MAALNLANELIGAGDVSSHLETNIKPKVVQMRERIESALLFGKQLEL
jgi:hypothetical protein